MYAKHWHCRNCTRQLSEILKELQDKTVQMEVACYVNVRHNLVWEDTCALLGRKQFNPKATVSVKFSEDDGNAEGTVDTGGPRREFFWLLLHAANEKADIFQGLLYRRVLFPNSSGELKGGAERAKSGEGEEDEGKLTLTPKNFQLKKRRREKLEKSTPAKKKRRKWKEDDTKVIKKRFGCRRVTPFRSEVEALRAILSREGISRCYEKVKTVLKYKWSLYVCVCVREMKK